MYNRKEFQPLLTHVILHTCRAATSSAIMSSYVILSISGSTSILSKAASKNQEDERVEARKRVSVHSHVFSLTWWAGRQKNPRRLLYIYAVFALVRWGWG